MPRVTNSFAVTKATQARTSDSAKRVVATVATGAISGTITATTMPWPYQPDPAKPLSLADHDLIHLLRRLHAAPRGDSGQPTARAGVLLGSNVHFGLASATTDPKGSTKSLLQFGVAAAPREPRPRHPPRLPTNRWEAGAMRGRPTMIYLKGSKLPVQCRCGCNVFTKRPVRRRYKCTACGSRYVKPKR